MKLIFLVLCSLLFAGFSASSQNVKGKVVEASTGDALIGATVTLTKASIKISRQTGLDGTYIFKNVQSGKYSISVSFVGFEKYTSEVEAKNEASSATVLNIKLNSTKNDLSAVTVSGIKSKESDEFARKTELNSSNIVNIVSAKAIEISPDIAIGNVLQRVSGVSMVRSGSGDGQYAIIRGLPNRYTYTSINGIILPSPDPQTRSIPLDMFPANMMERVEIIKSLTPNVEGNAIGGAANLILKNSPDRFTVNGTISTGINTVSLDRPFSGFDKSGINFKSPAEANGNTSNYVAKVSDFQVSHLNFKDVNLPLNLVTSLSIGNKLFNKKLGYLLGASFIREYRTSNTFLYTGGGETANPDSSITVNKRKYNGQQEREYSSLQSRFGLQGKLDYSFSSAHSIRLSGLFLQLDDNQHRAYTSQGVTRVGEINYSHRVAFIRKQISNITLSGYHKLLENLAADWTASYAEASSKRPDWVDFGYFKEEFGPRLFVNTSLTHQWVHSNDADKSAYANFKFTAVKNLELSAGGMYRSKTRSSYYDKHTLATVIAGAPTPIQPWTSINDVVFSFESGFNLGDPLNSNNYEATETVGALYLMAKYITLNNKLEIVGGLREERTKQDYETNISPANPAKTGSHVYTDPLPSANFKYKISGKQNLRLSYFSGISRPNLYEIIPASLSGDISTESGNANLRHTTSQNVDLRYEHYFSTNNYVVAGTFYKNLKDPIEVAFGEPGTPNANILIPTNPVKPVIVYGFEMLFSKFINNFGVSGNYTYIHSEVTTRKQIIQKHANGEVKNDIYEFTRPMQGQANHIANLSLLYKSAKGGLNAQLSYVYAGKRISVVSSFYGLDQWQRANAQLDFSINKNFRTRYTFFAKVTNILNSNIYQDILAPNEDYQKGYPGQGDPNRILVQKDVFKQSILAGLRFKF